MYNPALQPSSFVEFKDDCSGPYRYRSQPSRSNSDGVLLNDFMNKYVTAEYTDDDFIRLLSYLKHFNRTWTKVPETTKSEILASLLQGSTGGLSEQIKQRLGLIPELDTEENGIEHFGEVKSDEEAASNINQMIKGLQEKDPSYANVKCVPANNRMSMLCIVVVAIVCIVIGFLISYTK